MLQRTQRVNQFMALVLTIPLIFCKTLHIADCKQIDSRPLLDPVVLIELCAIITEIEAIYNGHSSLEMINQQIGRMLEG